MRMILMKHFVISNNVLNTEISMNIIKKCPPPQKRGSTVNGISSKEKSMIIFFHAHAQLHTCLYTYAHIMYMQLLYSHIVSTFRVLRLIEFIPKVRRLLWTVLRSLEASCACIISMCVFLYVYECTICILCRFSRGLDIFS